MTMRLAQRAIFPAPDLIGFILQIMGNEVSMRGDEERQEAVFVFDSLEDRVPAGHPLRRIRRLIDTALRDLDPVFEDLYAIPSERKLCEHLEFNLLFRWFVGLPFSEACGVSKPDPRVKSDGGCRAAIASAGGR